MNLIVETTTSFCNQGIYAFDCEDLLITNFYSEIKGDFSDELSEEEDDETEYAPESIGYINSYRFNLKYDYGDLCIVADNISQDLSYFASFLLLENNIEDDFMSIPDYIYYINTVFIEPKYRGHSYGLKALAVFLEMFAWGQVVGCHPCPIHDLTTKYSESKGKLLMRRYWRRVGLTSYSKKHNILWTEDWYMPTWLNSLIFSKQKPCFRQNKQI